MINLLNMNMFLSIIFIFLSLSSILFKPPLSLPLNSPNPPTIGRVIVYSWQLLKNSVQRHNSCMFTLMKIPVLSSFLPEAILSLPPVYSSIHQKFIEFNVDAIDTRLEMWSLPQRKHGNLTCFSLLECCKYISWLCFHICKYKVPQIYCHRVLLIVPPLHKPMWMTSDNKTAHHPHFFMFSLIFP